MNEEEKEIKDLKRHCNIGICIGVVALFVNVFNMIITWSKVL